MSALRVAVDDTAGGSPDCGGDRSALCPGQRCYFPDRDRLPGQNPPYESWTVINPAVMESRVTGLLEALVRKGYHLTVHVSDVSVPGPAK